MKSPRPASRPFPAPLASPAGAGQRRPTVWVSGDETSDLVAVLLGVALPGSPDDPGPAIVEPGALRDRLAHGSPDVLVLTGAGALDACERLRGAHDALSLPILVLGARVPDALSAGANDALAHGSLTSPVPEPWEVDDLAARVSALARTQRLHAGALAEAREELRHVEARLAGKRSPHDSMSDADGDPLRTDPMRVLPALGFLALAGEILTGPLDSAARIAGLARVIVPELADFCGVYLADEGGEVRLAEVVSVDPSHAELARARLARPGIDPRKLHPVVKVMRSGRSQLYAELTEARLARIAFDSEDLARLRATGLHSWLCVPLTARDKVLGALALARKAPRRCYDRADLVLCEELGRRAAGAIENAQLFELVERERLSAQEANRLKDEFLATLSHELRTPLTAILGWTRILRTRALPADRHARALEVIERNARAQNRLVEDLLDVSRMLAGHVTLEIAPADVALCIENALAELRPAAEAKGVSLRSVLDPAVGTLPADAVRLQQVVHILLSNSVKFTPGGGSVEVRLEPDLPSGARISVADTGEGIAVAFLPHVFDRFRQADGGVTRAHGGLGLGLAIARHLVGLHGGRIEARSEGEGLGATFTVHLPVP